MKWRVVLELVAADGTVCVHEVSGAAAAAEYAPRMIGLTLAEGKQMLAVVQRHLVRAQTKDHCRRRTLSVIRRGAGTPDRLPKVTPPVGPFHQLYQGYTAGGRGA